MSRKLSTLLPVVAFASATLATAAYAGDAPKDKYVWVPPVAVTQALNITVETKATAELLNKAAEQCVDADCKQHVEECRKRLATCVIVPSRESVHEMEMENN
jgi:hypothetical protein